MYKFVVDMMGGDLGSKETVIAVNQFINKHLDVEIFAVGKKEELLSLDPKVKIVDAKEVMPMDFGAMEALRNKESSMCIAVMKVIEENADALISCGGTGPLLSTSSVRLKKIPGVLRPALVSSFPTIKKNKYTVVLDLGANNENSVEELIQFAKMGVSYYKANYGKDVPTVAILANGTEDHKGSPVGQETLTKLKEINFPGFVGNIEASTILHGDVDVVITDGFNGNVCLKSIEGTTGVVKALLKDVFKSNIFSIFAYLIVKHNLKKTLSNMSSKKTGGAMFLGISKVVTKAHGNSDNVAFLAALETTYRLVKGDVIKNIEEGINE